MPAPHTHSSLHTPAPARPPIWDPSHYGYGPPFPNADPGDGDPGEPSPPRRPGWWWLGVAALVGGVVAALVSVVAIVLTDGDKTVESVFRLPEAGSNSTLEGTPLDIQGVLALVQPSVVTVSVGGNVGAAVFEGTGTGLIIGEDGLILTNAHVIVGAESITVTFFDGSSATAAVIGSFPDDDIAVIQAADVSGLVPATLGSSEALRVGDDVVAIGNALGLGGVPSVTRGIVSAKDRSIDADNISLEHLIQTDAAINPGNSGGPLVNAAGEVVGINTAIIDDAQNVGFALAIDVVKPLIERARAGDADLEPETAFIGLSTISVGSLDDAVLEEFAIAVAAGAFVQDIVADAPAAEAGIERGDVIVSIDGVSVATATDVARIVREREPGQRVDVVLSRGGVEHTVIVELAVR